MTVSAQNMTKNLCSEALCAARGLVLFRGVLKDPACQALLRFLEAVVGRERPDDVLDAYGELFYLLSNSAEEAQREPVGDAWQNHLLDRVLYDDNAFSRAAASSKSLGDYQRRVQRSWGRVPGIEGVHVRSVRSRT